MHLFQEHKGPLDLNSDKVGPQCVPLESAPGSHQGSSLLCASELSRKLKVTRLGLPHPFFVRVVQSLSRD